MDKICLKSFCSFVLLIFYGVAAFSQQRVFSGVVKDNNGSLIQGVTITLNDQNSLIISSIQTNIKGEYLLKLSDNSSDKAHSIAALTIGYKKQSIQISNERNHYNFVLEIEPVLLKQVEIKNRPNITKRGDTLSYDVNSFARQEDRHIGDVLKRLPGFTVEDDGRILFNGQAITTLYTGGDDLMGHRYSLATKSISKDMIKSVEVLKNHQPIKVLKDKMLTNDIAVNLVLKDNRLKYTGEGMLGLGLPHQFDVSANLIALSKNLKMLNSVKANNSGIDLRGFLKNLGTAQTFGSTNFNTPKNLIYSATIGLPNLPVSNYYINKSGMLSLNNLINTKSGFQFRANLQGLLDKNNLLHYSRITQYTTNDTISTYEKQYVSQQTKMASANVLLSKNNVELFLNNEINVNVKSDSFVSPLTLNNLNFNQTLNNKEFDIANSFSYIPKLSKSTILAFNWNTKYFSNPQN